MVDFNSIGFNPNISITSSTNSKQSSKESTNEEQTEQESAQQSASQASRDDVLAFMAQAGAANMSLVNKSNSSTSDIKALENETGYNVSKYVTPEQAGRIASDVTEAESAGVFV